jgi:hypothetical protein
MRTWIRIFLTLPTFVIHKNPFAQFSGMKSRIVSVVSTISAVLLLTFSVSCLAPPLSGVETTREFQGTYNVTHTALLEVHTLNGAVVIARGTLNAAQVNATLSTVYGSSELDRVQILVDTDNVLRVETIHPTPPARITVNYLITIPADLPVSIVETSNGGIMIQEAMGTALLTTSNGPIAVQSFSGDIAAYTSNGDITLKDVTGIASVSTSNAEVILQHVHAITLAETSNGRISADIMSADQDITLSTSNARVTIQIAPDLNADLSISTSNGQILLTNVPVTVQQSTQTGFRGILGQGGHHITVTTSNADIEVKLLTPEGKA